MIPTTTPRDALEALRNGLQLAQMQLTQATTPEQKQIAQFWVDYFARQISRWEGKGHAH